METREPHEIGHDPGGPDRFTGQAWISEGLSGPDGTGMIVVHFSPAARTHWHRHPGGQLLYVVSGRGRARAKGDAPTLLLPGQIVATSPEEWHFHGADPRSPMTHVAVNMGGTPEWGDPVTDEEYADGF